MPHIEDTYKGEKLVAEGEGKDTSLTIDGDRIPLDIDDHGDKTIFRYQEDLYRGYDDILELAKAIIDEDIDEETP